MTEEILSIERKVVWFERKVVWIGRKAGLGEGILDIICCTYR